MVSLLHLLDYPLIDSFLAFSAKYLLTNNTDKYISSQLILLSHNRLAQYWVGFGHISYFERVDIDAFLAPSGTSGIGEECPDED